MILSQNLSRMVPEFEFTYSDEQRKAHAKESHAEVLRLQTNLRQDVLEEPRLQNECVAEAVVIEALGFVENGQFLAQRNALLPALALVEVFQNLGKTRTELETAAIIRFLHGDTYFLIEILFALPLGLADVIVWCECQRLFVPAEHVRVQFQREPGFRVVLGLRVQIEQLVNVPQIHFLAIDFRFVEIQQVHSARHAFVAILVALHHTAIVQQAFQQSRH